MTGRADATAAAERALERLLRLSLGRSGQARQDELVGASVSRAGYSVLRALDDHGPLPLGELARACAMDPAAAVRQVQALEAEGLVERAASPGDARLKLALLTASGRAALERLVDLRVAYLDRALEGWTVAERAQLADSVERLTDGLVRTPYATDDEAHEA